MLRTIMRALKRSGPKINLTIMQHTEKQYTVGMQGCCMYMYMSCSSMQGMFKQDNM